MINAYKDFAFSEGDTYKILTWDSSMRPLANLWRSEEIPQGLDYTK